ncbi:uncharacterized protein LOC129592710 [Paramacrobiotus metropolitanus]|uniref:uncharacterized protein LOC129592710 n=1 Tax=Paramacrobiotus metropolitanus TaxID=2943436 RepID=UPI002445DF92|nr:uncharacterized protein LOC129592710 [Paramacrobiotus metropolitanus]
MPPAGKRAKFDNATVSRILASLPEDSSDPDNQYVLGLITDRQRQCMQAARRARKQRSKKPEDDLVSPVAPVDEVEIPVYDINPSDLQVFTPGFLNCSERDIDRWVRTNFIQVEEKELYTNYVLLFFRRYAESQKWIQKPRQSASVKRYLDIVLDSKCRRDKNDGNRDYQSCLALSPDGKSNFVQFTRLPLSKIIKS